VRTSALVKPDAERCVHERRIVKMAEVGFGSIIVEPDGYTLEVDMVFRGGFYGGDVFADEQLTQAVELPVEISDTTTLWVPRAQSLYTVFALLHGVLVSPEAVAVRRRTSPPVVYPMRHALLENRSRVPWLDLRLPDPVVVRIPRTRHHWKP
jgi:hypothetical protein